MREIDRRLDQLRNTASPEQRSALSHVAFSSDREQLTPEMRSLLQDVAIEGLIDDETQGEIDE